MSARLVRPVSSPFPLCPFRQPGVGGCVLTWWYHSGAGGLQLVEPREYYVHRRGEQRPTEDISSLRRMVVSEYSRLKDEGLFQWHFGYYCVDAGYVSGRSAGTDPGAYVHWNLGRDLWPFEEKVAELDEDWVFTVIEFLYDHAAAPTNSHYHDFSDCGIHVHAADDLSGRRTFRESMNRYLPRYDSGFELQETGEIWERAPAGLEFLEPKLTGKSSIDGKVQHAIATFRRRTATEQQKRDAINNLADVLEFLRSSEGTNLPGEEEDRLFEIANNYAIRHHNAKQKVKYDAEIWLDWMFYTFLNAIALGTAQMGRNAVGPSEANNWEGDLPFS